MTIYNALCDSSSGPASQRKAEVGGYFLACLCVALAFGLRLMLDPLWGDRVPYVTFFLAGLIVMRVVGGGPLAFTAGSGFLLADWFFVAPRHSLLITGLVNQVNAALFLTISAVLLFVSLRERRALAREQAAQEELRRNAEQLRASEARYSALVANCMDAILLTDPAGRILAANPEACKMFGRSEQELLRLGRTALVDAADQPMVEAAAARRQDEGRVQLEVRFVRSDGTQFVGEVSSGAFTDRDGSPRNTSIIRDISERKHAESERERLVCELQSALLKVKTLRGLLPICATCKKIRDDKGYWNQIEFYIRDHSDADFTHGICPECVQRFYGELIKPDSPPRT